MANEPKDYAQFRIAEAQAIAHGAKPSEIADMLAAEREAFPWIREREIFALRELGEFWDAGRSRAANCDKLTHSVSEL